MGVAAAFLALPTFGVSQEAVREPGHFAEVNGTRIYYEDRGEGEPLFLLHGFFGTTSRWDPYVDNLATQYRVIAWDMRGHGRSSMPNSSDSFHEDVARDLLGLMDQLHITRAKALGASTGAVALLHAATLEPDRFEAVALVGAFIYRDLKAREHQKRASFLDEPEVAQQLRQSHGEDTLQQLARQFRRFATLYGDPAFTPDILATISARTLIIEGDNDPYASVSQAVEMFNAIPHSHLWIVPNGGHLPHLIPSNRDDFLRRVTEFLDGGQWEQGSR